MENIKQTGIKLCSALFVLFIAFTIALCFFMGYYSVYHENCYTDQPAFVYYYPTTDYKLDRDNEDEKNIYDSREYQIRVTPGSFYPDRMKGVSELVNLLRNYTGLPLADEDWETTIYEEVQYLSKRCGRSYSEFRRRKYFDSNREVVENGTAVSINMDSYPKTYKKDALHHNLHPGAQYADQADEKIEQDIHTTYRKFNRETKIKHLPADFEVTTCGQAMEMFPYAFPSRTKPNTILPFNTAESVYYVWEYAITDHVFYGTTKVKFAFTLYFLQLSYCYDMSRKPMMSSEFSMRVYSLGNGWADWDYDALKYIAPLYQKLKKFY